MILFGDPGSNKWIAEVVKDLPLAWTKDEITFAGKTYPTDNHAVALVFPNPLNPRRYVVINSGHTFHEDAFKASNSWLFPRQGDAAVMQFKPGKNIDSYSESIEAGTSSISNGNCPSSQSPWHGRRNESQVSSE